jgi:hypothetical protein
MTGLICSYTTEQGSPEHSDRSLMPLCGGATKYGRPHIEQASLSPSEVRSRPIHRWIGTKCRGGVARTAPAAN